MAPKDRNLVCPIKHKLLEPPASELVLLKPLGCRGQLTIAADALANPKLASMAAQKQIKLGLASAGRRVSAAVSATESTVAELLRQDLTVQNAGAFQAASDSVASLEDTLAELVAGGLAAELESGVAKRLGLKARQVSSRLDFDFVPPGLLAEFPSQNRLLPDRYLLRRAIRLKRWQHCGVVSKGKLAYLLVDRKKPVKKGQLKALQKGMGMGGGVVTRGFCCWMGGQLRLRFLASASSAAPNKTQLKQGLAKLLGLKVKALVSCDLDSLPRSPKDLPPSS